MMRPWCSTAILCAIENTTSMSCSVNRSVSARSAAMRSMRRMVSCVSAADMPAVGSSSRSTDRGEQRRGVVAVERLGTGPEIAAMAVVHEEGRLHVLEHGQLRKDVGALE